MGQHRIAIFSDPDAAMARLRERLHETPEERAAATESRKALLRTQLANLQTLVAELQEAVDLAEPQLDTRSVGDRLRIADVELEAALVTTTDTGGLTAVSP